MHDTQQASVGDQRYAQHRADTLLPQDRIHHGVGADLCRASSVTSSRADPTGKTRTDWHVDALAHLILESPGRVGNKM